MYHLELKESSALPDLALPAGMRLDPKAPAARRLRVLDTVDWSVWQSGQVLLQDDDGRMELYDRHDHLKVRVICKKRHAIIKEVPEPLARELKPLISVRALVSYFDCQWQVQSLVFFNQDDKIVSRAELFTLSTGAPALLRLYPLRGYDREAAQIVQALNPVTTPVVTAITTRFLLERSGLVVRPPATRPEFHLVAHQPTEEAVLGMVVELLRLARQQEKGLIADIDTEFTHQYRVNLRKARSLLSLFKKDLSPQRYRAVQMPLKSMAKVTNQLRDLDVFLLDQNDYRAMLPTHFQPGLDELFKRLKRRRQQAWRKVTATLKKEEYLENAQQLEQRLKEPPDVSVPRSGTAIKKRVSRKILSQYQKIQRYDARIDAATPDEQVHELRIEAKKLRYLLELFAELFSYDQLRRLIKALKKLQDNLGRFNDYSSQCLFLESLLCSAGIKTAERDAISGLIAVLYSKQKKEREQVVDMIAAFSGTEIAEQFQELFTDAAAKDDGS